MISLLILFLSGTCSAAASIFLRLAGQMSPVVPAGITATLAMPGLYYRGYAVVAYSLGFILYALALRTVKLNVAYSFMVSVTLLEILLFGVATGDTLTIRSLCGAGFLIMGVYLLYA